MPRQARIVLPNTSHHITQRGNYRQKVFDNSDNYKQYCKWLTEYAQENNVDILAYCLMDNHVHFILIPKEENDLAILFKTLHMRYAHYMNRQRRAKGHFWQGRFYSCILDDAHLYRAIRYVENNPVRAKIVKKAWEYKFSSARDHTEQRDKPLIRISRGNNVKDGRQWQEYLQEGDLQMAEDIRLKTNRGLVVGTDKFIKKIEGVLNRSLKCLKQGRPRKSD